MKRFREIGARVGGYYHHYNVYQVDAGPAERLLERLDDEIPDGCGDDYSDALNKAVDEFNILRVGSPHDPGYKDVYTLDDIKQILDITRREVRKVVQGRIKDLNKMLDKLDGKG